MSDRLFPGGPGGTSVGNGRNTDHYNANRVQHARTSPHHLKQETPDGTTERRRLARIVAAIRDYLPRGNTLDDETFRRRHLLLCWILGLHVPALFAFGLYRGYGLGHTALEVAPVDAALLF